MSHPYVILNPYVILSKAKDLILLPDSGQEKMSHPYVILSHPYVILSKAKDLVLIGHGHAPCHSSLKSRQSGLIDSIKATFFARNQPLMCFSRARAAFTSDVSST